ncbi:ribonuclease J [Myxococcota bacterium]|nr:ribonuclease J [Myxococcota bacterium]MBU1381974.1 ribonuclease J [Myxococcota bacterium]MBU1495406.1 ribonuclease J [Myxococcota bacterium]
MNNNFIKAIGGFGEFGGNCTLISVNGHGIIIDSGIMFSSDDSNGIDKIIPDFSLIGAETEVEIDAVIITHSHEDHTGSLYELLKTYKVPVYLSSYAINPVRDYLFESGIKDPLLVPINDKKSYKINDFFTFTAIEVDHSIPSTHCIFLEFKTINERYGFLVTGDFKKGTWYDTAAQYSGMIDFMLCDSTGSMSRAQNVTEVELLDSFEKIMESAQGRIFFTLFSSNAERMKTIMEAAARHQRHVTVCGRGAEKHFSNALDCGVIAPSNWIPSEDLGKYDENQQVIIITGSQGEPNSALNRLSLSIYPEFKIKPGDLIIFSSRIIPGRELAISRMQDRLLRLGAEIIDWTSPDHVHTSGHGYKTDITDLVQVIIPHIFIPQHGTLRHLKESFKAVSELGICESCLIENSDKVIFTKDRDVEIVKGPGSTNGWVDSPSGVFISKAHMNERRKIGARGICIVSIVVSETYNEASFRWYGTGNDQIDPKIEKELNKMLKKHLISDYSEDELERAVRGTVSDVFKRNYGKKPIINIFIHKFGA